MLALPTALDVPLYQDESGAIRIRNTRVHLYLVIRAFLRGETPESIVQMYTTLSLRDVYAVITHYLDNRADVDAYLADVETKSTALRQQIEASQPPMTEIRERLLNRLAEKK